MGPNSPGGKVTSLPGSSASSQLNNKAPEKRGFLLNDQSGRKEFFVLRAGILRSYRSEKTSCELLNQIHLAHSGEVNLLHDGVLEIKSHSPFTWEYTLVASSEEEAEAWYLDCF